MFKMVLSLNVAIASIDDGCMMPRTWVKEHCPLLWVKKTQLWLQLAGDFEQGIQLVCSFVKARDWIILPKAPHSSYHSIGLLRLKAKFAADKLLWDNLFIHNGAINDVQHIFSYYLCANLRDISCI